MLSKEVCQKCWHDMYTQTGREATKWSIDDDLRWEDGYAPCPWSSIAIVFVDDYNAPDNCPYQLEHLMGTQKIRKEKKHVGSKRNKGTRNRKKKV